MRPKSPTSEAPSPKSTTSKFSISVWQSSPATETEPRDYFMSIAFEQTAEPTALVLCLATALRSTRVLSPTPPVLSRRPAFCHVVRQLHPSHCCATTCRVTTLSQVLARPRWLTLRRRHQPPRFLAHPSRTALIPISPLPRP